MGTAKILFLLCRNRAIDRQTAHSTTWTVISESNNKDVCFHYKVLLSHELQDFLKLLSLQTVNRLHYKLMIKAVTTNSLLNATKIFTTNH